MQLAEVLYYVLLTITVTATCVQGGRPRHLDRSLSKKMKRRDTALLVDSYPTGKTIVKQPRFIYSKIKKHRRGKPLPKHARPTANYVPGKPRQRPGKKHYPELPQHTSPRQYKKRTAKPTYARTKPSFSFHEASTVNYHTNFGAEPTGFAEPPYFGDVNVPKHGYNHIFELMSPEGTFGETPVESYRVPVPEYSENTYIKTPKVTSQNIFDEEESGFGEEHNMWRNPRIKATENNADTYSTLAKPTSFLKQIDQNHDLPLVPHANIYNHESRPDTNNFHYYTDHEKPKTIWKLRTKYDNKVLVGGQYAEPPARYVSDVRSNLPVTTLDGEFDPTRLAAPSVSSYVNYKHSNMAFSPQNLNDAFGTIK